MVHKSILITICFGEQGSSSAQCVSHLPNRAKVVSVCLIVEVYKDSLTLSHPFTLPAIYSGSIAIYAKSVTALNRKGCPPPTRVQYFSPVTMLVRSSISVSVLLPRGILSNEV